MNFKPSFLILNIYQTSKKYEKGRTAEAYFIKLQDMIKLSLWKPTDSMLSFISTTKLVSF